jgi:hypothetical protein
MDNKDWNPMKTFNKTKKRVEALGIPKFSLTKEYENTVENLFGKYDQITEMENKQLEEFLLFFGGYKATLEHMVADKKATVGLLEASYNDKYSTTLSNITREYDKNNKKKPTKDELRGEILENEDVLELRQGFLEHQAELIQQEGLLAMYTAFYNNVSRVVSIRTHGQS